MSTTVIESLKTSQDPHLYLLHVGLSKELYDSTGRMPLNEKEQLANTIIKRCSHQDILKIIKQLAELEFQVESDNPLRSGNRFLAQLIRAYTAKVERISFTGFYESHVKNGLKNVSDFDINSDVKDMWAVVEAAAKATLSSTDLNNFKEKGLKVVPIFYYQQLLDSPTPQDIANGAKPVDLMRDPALDAFNEHLHQNKSLPALAQHTDLQSKLLEIKNHILATQWKVGGFLMFQGGVKYGDKRVPHRVNDILNLIDKAQQGDLTVRDAYDQIIVKAKEAIDTPRAGRASSTTTFYKEIFNHHILDGGYSFKTLDTESSKAHLLKQG